MKKRVNFTKIKQSIPYILTSIVIIAIVFVGSMDKKSHSTTLNLGSPTSDNYAVSTDQISELYIIADLSNALNLASSEDLAYNYVAATSIYSSGQSTTDKLEKPVDVDVSSLSRRVISYTVSDGESMASIADKFKLSTDQIRWSNGLKNTNLSAGTTLYLTQNVSGIVYTVKSGDTLESIASKYGSTVANIIALNNLEVSGISEGMKIAIEGGTLPTTERPEYVAPSTYITYGGSAQRINTRVISNRFYDSSYPYPSVDPGQPGQCTWYAWWWRATDSKSLGALPHAGLGHAYSWANTLRKNGYTVNHTPEVGAVFQTTSGKYGHVGVVIAVNPDGTITVREMNYGKTYRVTESEIPARYVSNLNYIH